MRPSLRIENFLKRVDWNQLLYERWKIPKDDLIAKKICYMSGPTLPEAWNKNPDQRIGQLLINLGMIDDSIERWCTEEYEILIDQGVAPEDCFYWTSVFDKDGEKLETPITRRIADLEDGHAKNILIWIKKHNVYINPLLMTALKNKAKQEKAK